MTLRPISCLLDILAEETDELATIARRLDTIIPSIIANLPDTQNLDVQELQRIDALWQHLQDTARALRKMASLVDSSTELCAATLIEEVQLDYFKSLLQSDHATKAKPPDHGRAHIF